jgi:hypothetical protein
MLWSIYSKLQVVIVGICNRPLQHLHSPSHAAHPGALMQLAAETNPLEEFMTLKLKQMCSAVPNA